MKIHKRRRKKTETQRFTFIVLPSSTSKLITMNLSKRIIMGCLAVLLLLSAGLLTTAVKYYFSQEDINRVEQIKQESRNKDKTIKMMGNEINEIEKQQQTLIQKQNELKKMMGLKTNSMAPEPSRGGKGGTDNLEYSGPAEDMLVQTQNIKTKLALREKELDEMMAKVKNDNKYFCALPNQWPTSGEISSSFGWRKSPFGGQSETFHDGLDLACNTGTPVVAAGDGKVIYAAWKAVYGKTIEIDHGYGLVSMYGHNSQMLVKEGDKVKKGQIIARVGNTGRSTGPHLHFSIYKQTIPQDPLVYLPETDE